MNDNKEIREAVSITLPKEISDCLEVMHGVEKIRKSKKSKSVIVEEVLAKGFEAMGIDPSTYGQDIQLGNYGSTT